jgi:hypothetical protein
MHLIDEFDADYLQQSTANFGNQLHYCYEPPTLHPLRSTITTESPLPPDSPYISGYTLLLSSAFCYSIDNR